jgi:hypothetical protein
MAASCSPPRASSTPAQVLLNEGKPEFENQTEDLIESAFVLHVMASHGSAIAFRR